MGGGGLQQPHSSTAWVGTSGERGGGMTDPETVRRCPAAGFRGRVSSPDPDRGRGWPPLGTGSALLRRSANRAWERMMVGLGAGRRGNPGSVKEGRDSFVHYLEGISKKEGLWTLASSNPHSSFQVYADQKINTRQKFKTSALEKSG